MELLAPAGDREAMVAAVQNGADAVYLGGRAFNARRGAGNFDGAGLREAADYCHVRGVKLYVTLNTMVRQDEMAELEDAIGACYLAGADAFIVQDIGVAEAVRRIAPAAELHASTQMAVHNRQGVDFLARRGFARVVLAREMEFSHIAQCAGRGVALEAFAHGALCVSASGQCLFSSMIGGRSGNRGMCAQPCRMLYRMGEREGYLLSPRDLMTVEMVDRYRAAGVSSMKIEGRMKRPEYVAVATRMYRRAIDGEQVGTGEIDALKQMFNRGGFTKGYAPGLEDRLLMDRTRPNHAGLRAGRCEKSGEVTLEAEILRADALVLRSGARDEPVRLAGRAGERVSCPRARKGDVLVRLVSEDQMKDTRESYAREARQIPIRARLSIEVGAPAHLRVTDGAHAVEVSGGVVAPAQKRPLDEARVRAQLQKTGGTPYRMDEVEIITDQNGYLPLSEINELRRDALSMLTRVRCALDREAGSLGDHRAARFEPEKTALRVQSGDVDALLTARDCGADDVIYAPQDMRDLSAAHRLGRFYLAIPQQMCAEELENIHVWARAHADEIAGVYLTNVAQLDLDWPGERIADFPLNIANDLAAMQIAADAYVPSVELTARQIGALGGKKEIVVYGELPLMQLRHCPRRAAEDLPGLHRDCRVCDGGAGLSPLVDRTGARFPLVRIAYDTGCVIEVRNSVPLMLLRRVEKLPAASAWRLLVDARDARAATTLHRMALNGRDFKQSPLWREMEQKKTTTGHFFRGVE